MTVAEALDRRVWSATAALLPEDLPAPRGQHVASEDSTLQAASRH